MIEAGLDTTHQVFHAYREDLNNERLRRKMTYGEFAKLTGVTESVTKRTLEGISYPTNGRSPMKSNRLTTILRMRHALNKPTIVQTKNGKEQFNLNLSEDRDRLAKKIHRWLGSTVMTNAGLDRLAGLANGQTSGIFRRPSQYLTLRVMLQVHSKWIETLVFAS